MTRAGVAAATTAGSRCCGGSLPLLLLLLLKLLLFFLFPFLFFLCILAVVPVLEALVEGSEFALEDEPLYNPKVIVLGTCVDAMGQQLAPVDVVRLVLGVGVSHTAQVKGEMLEQRTKWAGESEANERHRDREKNVSKSSE